MEFVFVIPRTELFPESTPHGVVLFDSYESEVGSGTATETAKLDAETLHAETLHTETLHTETLHTETLHTQGERWSRAAFDACVREEGYFIERAFAERTPSLKQVIPYTVVVRGRAAGATEVLLLQRTKSGGEARLHDKLSIGVGGHVNPIDAAANDSSGAARVADPLPAATRREVMEEELTVTGATRLFPVGILNDDTTPVGAVHVGFVQILELLDGDATIREVDQLRGEFVSVDELHKQLAAGANYETWSSMLVPLLDSVLSTIPVATGPHVGGTDQPTAPLQATAHS